jgi:hypothetical protein
MSSPISAAPPGAASKPRSNSKRAWVPLVVAIVLALLFAGMHVVQRIRSSQGFRLEFSVASRIPFQQETPRVGQLTVISPNGSTQTLVSRCYASAFLDARSAFRFEVRDETVKRVVFSPAVGDDLVAITRIALTRTGKTEPELIPLEKLVPFSGAEVVKRDADRLMVRTTAGEHPAGLGLAFDEPTHGRPPPLASLILEAIALFIVSFGLSFYAIRVAQRKIEQDDFRWNLPIPILFPFAIVTCLILAMALLSKFNAHPDEYLHFETARYFINHWWPAALNDPVIAPTFSHYGFSYMHDLDASYFLMGKFIALFQGWLATPEIAARLFNVLLFVLLAVWVARRLGTSLAPFILLISPQIWYVFSYVNGDAWALFVAMLIVIQLADQKSALQSYLESKRSSGSFEGALQFALLLAVMIMAKRNYYLFLLFVAFVSAWTTLTQPGWPVRLHFMRRWGIIFLLAAAFFFPLRIAHEALNGFDIPRLQLEQAEKHAAPHFKPSEIAAGTGSPRLVLRKQGVPFAELITERGWLGESFQSFCGVYRWMTLKGSDYYYILMWLLYTALVLLLLVRVIRLSWHDAFFTSGVLTTACLVVLGSVYSSWTADYQAQGRYLFPILPMFAFLFHRYRDALRSRAFYLLFGCLFACSIYSFIFTALRNIPK